MAVIIKYIVERKGVEKMTFTSKKEADAYDKMLDSADQIALFLSDSPVSLDDQQLEEIGLYVASNKDVLQNLFKGQLYKADKSDKEES
ncbi:YebG family protein [Psychromonas aquatilis]|uniref:YebG family protein n=1 Tax=Psychromonas aquatilis TaxID=2005072 RepID=A0ABU9GPK8_9GAMM